MDTIVNSDNTIRQQAAMTTSGSGGTGPDELVPSRYALRVGAIEVLVISDGVLPQPAATIGTNADPAELAAWLDDKPPHTQLTPSSAIEHAENAGTQRQRTTAQDQSGRLLTH